MLSMNVFLFSIFEIYSLNLDVCHQIEWIQMRTIPIKSMKTYQIKPEPMKSHIDIL